MKTTIKRALAGASLTVLAMAATGSAFAADEFAIDRVLVVGDSLSDGGAYTANVSAQLQGGGVPTAIIPDRLRFTTNNPNGLSLTYAELLAQRLGAPTNANVITGIIDPATGALIAPAAELGGFNYAQGGSRVSNPIGIGFASPPPDGSDNLGITTLAVTAQVDRLLAEAGTLDGGDLIIGWGGNNDALAQFGGIAQAAGAAQATASAQPGATPASIQAAVSAAINTALPGAIAAMATEARVMATQMQRLRDAGATNLTVVTIPRIGTNTPFGTSSEAALPGAGAIINTLVDTFNATLEENVAGAASVTNSDRLLNAVLDDPAAFGFSDNVNQRATFECDTDFSGGPSNADSSLSCITGLNTLSDGELRVFADAVHPSAEAHALFADAAFAGVRAATQVGAIPVATLTALRQQSLGLDTRLSGVSLYMRDRNTVTAEFTSEDQFATHASALAAHTRATSVSLGATGSAKRRPVGHIEVYGGAEVGFYKADAQPIAPGIEGTTQVAKVAADIMVAPNAMIGAGLSLDHGQVDFDGDAGSFDSRLIVGGLFGVAEIIPGLYVNAAGGYGYIDVTDYERNFNLGASRQSYSGETDGEYLFGKVGIGAVLPVAPSLVFNPSIGFTYEKVDIDGFTESTGPASLSFGDTEFESQRLSVGIAAFASPEALGGLRLGARVSYEHDFNDDDLIVSFSSNPATLAPSAAPRPDGDFAYLSGLISYPLTDTLELTAQGTTIVGAEGTSGYTGALVLKASF